MHVGMAIGKKIAALRRAFGETQAVFGERLGVEQATVSRWEQGEPPQRRYEKPIAELANMSVAEFFHSDQQPRLIPKVGKVSGGSVEMNAPQSGGAVSHVTISLGENGQISLVVVGNTLAAAGYRNGDTLIANKLPKAKMAKAIGRDCIVVTATGEALIKNVRKGTSKGLYTLRDLRPHEDDMEDVDLQWAAPIVWIGRA